jgi:hypothetical protein
VREVNFLEYISKGRGQSSSIKGQLNEILIVYHPMHLEGQSCMFSRKILQPRKDNS